MYKVTSQQLGEDFTSVSQDTQVRDLRVMDAARLQNLLERFSHLPPVAEASLDPRVDIHSSTGHYIVRSNAGRLFFYDHNNPSGGATEMSAEEILRFLETSRTRVPEQEEGIPLAGEKKGAMTPGRTIAIAMLVIGLALNGFTVYSAFYIDDINQAPPLTLVTDARALQGQRDALSGSFATGAEKGDRGIVIAADGTLRLLEFGAGGNVRSEQRQSYSVGHRGKQLYLAMKSKGQVEVTNIDTLVFYGDVYRRTQ